MKKRYTEEQIVKILKEVESSEKPPLPGAPTPWCTPTILFNASNFNCILRIKEVCEEEGCYEVVGCMTPGLEPYRGCLFPHAL